MPSHRQSDLFSDDVPGPNARDLRITPQSRAPLDKTRRTFNRLLGEVQKLKGQLVTWSDFESTHRQRVASELMPRIAGLTTARRELIQQCADTLDGKHGGSKARKTERRHLTAFLLELCEAHLLDDGHDDDAVLAVHDRFAAQSFAEAQAAVRQQIRDEALQFFGLEIPDDADEGTLEEFVSAALSSVAGEGRVDGKKDRAPGRRDHGAKPQADNAARDNGKPAGSDVGQSLREVYRKLASALHPDRGTDAADRDRRHELMLRVNQAYEASDLVGLLVLQLEINQIDEDHLSTASNVRLEHFNHLLREQVSSLKDQLDDILQRFLVAMDAAPRTLTRTAVERDFERCLEEAEADAGEILALTEALRDPGYRSRWLQNHAREQREMAQRMRDLEARWAVEDDPLSEAFKAFGSARRQRGTTPASRGRRG